MRKRIMETVLPTIFGIFAVVGLLVIFNLIVHNGNAFTSPDNGFFKFFVPLTTIIALSIQFILVHPFWKKFKSQKKVWGLTLFQFTAIHCIISGLIFGLVFWEISFGIKEIISLSITGIISFAVYWTVNLLTLNWINKS